MDLLSKMRQVFCCLVHLRYNIETLEKCDNIYRKVINLIIESIDCNLKYIHGCDYFEYLIYTPQNTPLHADLLELRAAAYTGKDKNFAWFKGSGFLQ